MSNRHGLLPENLREDAYFAAVDQQLLESLREALLLQQEAQEAAAGHSRVEQEAPAKTFQSTNAGR